MNLKTREDAKKEFQEKSLILESNFKIALKDLRNSITYQKTCIICSKVMNIKVSSPTGKFKKTCSSTCRARYNRRKNGRRKTSKG